MKKLNLKISGYLILIISLAACDNQQTTISELATIDIEQAYQEPLRELVLSEVVEKVEYIKLQTLPGLYISHIGDIGVSENFLAIHSNENNNILLFSKTGEFLNIIGSSGKGPGEYTRVDQKSLMISHDEKSVLFLDGNRKIFQYSLDGGFLRVIELPLSSNRELHILSDGSIIVYQDRKHQEQTEGPVLYKFDKDLKLVDSLFYTHWDNSLNGKTYAPDMIFVENSNIFFKQFYNDTVFKINKRGTKSPEYLISLGDLEPPSMKLHYMETWSKYMVIEGLYSTNQYILALLIGKRRVPQSRNYTNELVWYNKKSTEVFMTTKMTRNDLDGIEFYASRNPKTDILWDKLSIIDYKSFIDGDSVNISDLSTQKYYGRLKELVGQSSIEDNPIIRILHLK